MLFYIVYQVHVGGSFFHGYFRENNKIDGVQGCFDWASGNQRQSQISHTYQQVANLLKSNSDLSKRPFKDCVKEVKMKLQDLEWPALSCRWPCDQGWFCVVFCFYRLNPYLSM